MKAIAIILAAGQSLRMGIPKALLNTDDGLSFVARLAKVFASAGVSPLVVVGAHAAKIHAANPGISSVLNAHWPEGQLSSARVGVRAALAQGANLLLIHPVDAPMVCASTVAQVVAELAHSKAIIAAFEGKRGHPIGLHAAAARALLTSKIVTLEEGLTWLHAREVEVDDPMILDNLNSPETYRLRFGCTPRPT